MKYKLQDGRFAHLRSALQVTDYQRPYLEAPADAVAEIKRLARQYIPAWKKSNLELVGVAGVPLRDQLLRGELPAVLCICEVVAYLGPTSRAAWLHLVWMQTEFTIGLPHSIEQEVAQLDSSVWAIEH